MCKWSSGIACPELGPTPWSSECPLPPPAWFEDALDAFIQAFDAARSGEWALAVEWLAETRDAELREWMHLHAQNAGPWRAGMSAPPKLVQRAQRESLQRFEGELWDRDGYRCCYCGLRVLHPRALRWFSQLIGPEKFPVRGGNLTRHGIKVVSSASLNHVVPVACGGETSPANLVTACWCCNYGKAEFTLEELGLDWPSTKPDLDWLGLSDRI